ncbi:MAG: DUF3106 domain-containing protein [Pseudomonadota bacterium]
MIASVASSSVHTTAGTQPAQNGAGKTKGKVSSQYLLVAGFLFLGGLSVSAMAQQPAKAAAAASSASSAGKYPKAAVAASRPAWTELTSLQQQTLKPLAASWNTLSEAQKRKWLEISKNYHSLPPEGQTTMHSRMNEWVALSPQQRAEARLNFAKTKELSKQLTPEEKKAKWQTYQALSPEEKQKLAAKATIRPVGAATAVKPVSPQKLAAVPPHGVKPDVRAATKIAPSPTLPVTDAVPGSAAPAVQH